MPLSDWRDGDLTLGNPDGFRLAEDSEAMQAMISAGEGYDWYYASPEDRRDRIRTPITDGMAGKPWVYRYKDIANWWGQRHRNRIGGAEQAVPTAWTAGAKPIWFTELGCPAIDKGANQPNVFTDPKSSESAAPYASNGARCDAMQRRFLQAQHRFWQGDGAPACVDADHMFVWTWDARPMPAFPENTGLWSDSANWQTGHWVNGRLGSATAAEVIAAVLADHGFEGGDVSGVSGDLHRLCAVGAGFGARCAGAVDGGTADRCGGGRRDAAVSLSVEAGVAGGCDFGAGGYRRAGAV